MKEKTQGSRSSFSGRVGYVLAVAGSAVGLGNIWRFPYLAARYGGGMFLLTYLVLMFTFGYALIVSEGEHQNQVVGYDPFLSVHWALSLSRAVHFTADLDELYRQSDYITLHLPQNKDTKGMIDRQAIAKMKDGVRIVNMARGGLICDGDVVDALKAGKIAAYVTDFPTSSLLAAPNVTALPHLGASTPESEDNCAVMAARELADYLENGNIVHSVNLPECTMPWSGTARLCILHRNAPGILANITAAVSGQGMNVENMTNKSRGDYAYTIVDVNAQPGEDTVARIREMENVLRVRLLVR